MATLKAYPSQTLVRATVDGYQLWELLGEGIAHVPTHRVDQDGRLVGEFSTPAAAGDLSGDPSRRVPVGDDRVRAASLD